MNPQSSYIYTDDTDPEGLGRIAPMQLPQLQPAIGRPKPMKSTVKIAPRPIPKPAPNPVIEKRHPSPAPRLLIDAIKKSAKKTKSTSNTSSNKTSTTSKSTSKTQTNSKGFLEGSLHIGSVEIKKTHAAAGGATLTGLLLWKLLF